MQLSRRRFLGSAAVVPAIAIGGAALLAAPKTANAKATGSVMFGGLLDRDLNELEFRDYARRPLNIKQVGQTFWVGTEPLAWYVPGHKYIRSLGIYMGEWLIKMAPVDTDIWNGTLTLHPSVDGFILKLE